jgi:hypothetical protein
MDLKDKLRHWTKEEIVKYGIRRFKEDSAFTEEELIELDELDDEDRLTPDSFADDLGNIIGESQTVFVAGRAPLPTDDEGNVIDTDENGDPLPRDKDGNLLGTRDPL